MYRYRHILALFMVLMGAWLGPGMLAQVTYDPASPVCIGETVTISGDTISWDDIGAVRLVIGPADTLDGLNFQNLSDSVSFEVPSWSAFSGNQASVTVLVENSDGDLIVLSPNLIVNRLEPTGVNAGNNQTICAGSSATLTATADPTGGTYTYLWSPATGLSSTTAASVTASPTSTTTYTVTVTGTTCGFQESAQVTVTVRAIPSLTAVDVTPPTCPGEEDAEVRITATGSAALQFRLGNSGGFTPAANPVTGVGAGTYDLQLRYTNDPRCQVNFANEVTVEDPILPPAIINIDYGNPAEVTCAGESITYTATTQSGATAYNWTFGTGADPETGSGPTPAPVTYPEGGSYDVTLTMLVGPNDCPVEAAETVEVTPLPQINSVVPSPTSDCGASDGSVRVNVAGGPGGFEFRLTGNGITRDWQDSRDFADLPAGNYNVSVRYSDQICPVDWPTPVVVTDPGAPTSSINISPLVACAGEVIELSAPDQAGVAFTWSFGVGASPANASGPGPHTVTYSSAGEKTVVLNLAEGECTGTVSTHDLVILPIPTLTIVPPVDARYTDGDSLLTRFVSQVDEASFAWTLTVSGGGLVGLDTVGTDDELALLLTLASPAPASATYEVIAEAEGCADTVRFSFEVTPETGDPEFIIPDLFTPNGDSFNDSWDITLVGNRDPKAYLLRVFNRSGALVYEDDLSRPWDGNTSAGSPVPTGAYWFVIVPTDGLEQPLAKGAVTLLR